MPSLDDVDRTSLSSLACPVRVLVSERGLCLQRNTILDSIVDADVVLFLDDDFLMTPTYIEDTELLFRTRRDIVMSHGGGHCRWDHRGGYLGRRRPETGTRFDRPQKQEKSFKPIYNAYGCNMAVRVSAIVASGVRFDENLPFYGWLEDVDFSRMMAQYGEVICADHLQGVHLGTKAGRTTGDQVRIFADRQSDLSRAQEDAEFRTGGCANGPESGRQSRQSLAPEPWVDRKGRLQGQRDRTFRIF